MHVLVSNARHYVRIRSESIEQIKQKHPSAGQGHAQIQAKSNLITTKKSQNTIIQICSHLSRLEKKNNLLLSSFRF
jgi:hypothetical protein